MCLEVYKMFHSYKKLLFFWKVHRNMHYIFSFKKINIWSNESPKNHARLTSGEVLIQNICKHERRKNSIFLEIFLSLKGAEIFYLYKNALYLQNESTPKPPFSTPNHPILALVSVSGVFSQKWDISFMIQLLISNS